MPGSDSTAWLRARMKCEFDRFNIAGEFLYSSLLHSTLSEELSDSIGSLFRSSI